MQGKTKEEIEMMKIMGFGNFDTTKVRILSTCLKPRGSWLGLSKISIDNILFVLYRRPLVLKPLIGDP